MEIKELNEAFQQHLDWNNFLEKVIANTDANNHSENYVLIANYFGLTELEEKFQEFVEIRDREQGLDLDVAREQYKLYCEMFDKIEELVGKDKARELRSCT